jgi:predicted cation transporter
VYLVAALIALWLIGMNTLAEGYLTVEVVRDPFASVVSPLSGGGLEDVVKAAFFEALAKHARTSLPLGVAQILLGGLLVFVAVRALFGRRATGFTLQLVLANAALLVAVYALREPVRGAIVDAVVRSGLEQHPSGMSAREFDHMVRLQWWWRLRVGFGVQLTALLLSAFALTRKAARELLTGVEPSTTDEF